MTILPSENDFIVFPNNSCMVALMGFKKRLSARTVYPAVTEPGRIVITTTNFLDKKTALASAERVKGYHWRHPAKAGLLNANS